MCMVRVPSAVRDSMTRRRSVGSAERETRDRATSPSTTEVIDEALTPSRAATWVAGRDLTAKKTSTRYCGRVSSPSASAVPATLAKRAAARTASALRKDDVESGNIGSYSTRRLCASLVVQGFKMYERPKLVASEILPRSVFGHRSTKVRRLLDLFW